MNTGYQPWLHKNSVAAIKTATLKKSNFLGAPQNLIFGGVFFMCKYSDEIKIKVVEYCIKENHNYLDAAKHFNIKGKSGVLKWVRKYKEHGVEGLIKNNQHYDGEYKQKVIEYMRNNNLSLMKTCIKFNLGKHAIVGKWERIYYEEGPQTLYEERRGRSQNQEKRNYQKIVEKI